MTPESKLYSFLDNQNSFTIHFLEGQRVIEDLAILHSLKGAGFSYYRDLLLSVLPMVSFLKKGESFGFYLDSETPYFRFKLETNFTGNFRTLLLPKDFAEFPSRINGLVRFSKLFDNAAPYTTIMQVEDKDFSSIINQLLNDSYQIQGQVQLSDIVDQSFFVSKIPRENVGRYIIDPGMGIDEYMKKKGAEIQSIFGENYTDENDIKKFFEAKGFYFLGAKPFRYFCSCSKERMIKNLITIGQEDLDHVFEGKSEIEIQCDYCNKIYHIARNDFAN